MEHIFSKIKPDILLHSIYRIKDVMDLKTEREDITVESAFLQCAVMKPTRNKTYKAHKHVIKSQSTFEFQVQEAFIVISGQVTIVIFDIDDSLLCEVVLHAGDLAVILAGGHTIKIGNINTVLYEIKTGPYEGQLLDKKFI